MARRLSIAVGLACVVTFGLFWSMQALIGASGELKEGRPAPSIEFVRLKRDRAPAEQKREPAIRLEFADGFPHLFVPFTRLQSLQRRRRLVEHPGARHRPRISCSPQSTQ